jgi:hypothetical protein
LLLSRFERSVILKEKFFFPKHCLFYREPFIFLYNVFHKKSNTVQIRVSKGGDKRSTWLNGLSELVLYAVSKLAQQGVRKGTDITTHQGQERESERKEG